ncbi:MAG: sodium:solute symporter [bacterium]
MFKSLTMLDFFIILIYFGLLLTVGFYYSRKEKNSSEYFLAGRNVGWVAIGSSMFAANISSEHFIGLAGAGASRGITAGNFELLACFMVLLLGWVFAPLYLKMGVFTLPEFLEKRYNRSCRVYLTSVSLIAYVFTKISVTILAGGFLLYETLGWDIATSAVVIVVIAGIYSIAGGLNAIVRVDILQTIVLIAGATILTLFGLHEIGGFAALRAAVPMGHFELFKPFSDPDFPWTGIVLGAPILGIWYWCTDQYIVQRILGAKNIMQARSGAIFAGFLKLLPLFILILPGIIALALYGNGNLGDRAFPLLVAGNLLPAGIKGIVIASLLAALISSLASVFNSSSTLFTMDFYRNLRKKAKDDELVLVGRLSTTVLVITAILAIPFIKFISTNMYVYLQSMQAYISPPIAAVFIWGIIWKKGTGKAAIITLVTGGIIGGIRLIVELLKKTGHTIWEPLHSLIMINFLHFAVILFVFSSGILIITSFMSTESFQKKYSQILASQEKDKKLIGTGFSVSKRLNVVLSTLLVCIVVSLYVYFF